MTFESSNTEWIEQLPDEKLVENLRIAMSEGCIKPCAVYDQLDELIQRFCKYQDLARSLLISRASLI